MAESYSTLIEQFPWVATLVGITCLVLAAWLTNSVFKRLILRGIQRVLSSTSYGIPIPPYATFNS